MRNLDETTYSKQKSYLLLGFILITLFTTERHFGSEKDILSLETRYEILKLSWIYGFKHRISDVSFADDVRWHAH